MIIALNILAFVFLLFLVKSPNKGITSFQFMLPSIVIVVDNIVEATYNPAMIFQKLLLIKNSLLNIMNYKTRAKTFLNF